MSINMEPITIDTLDFIEIPVTIDKVDYVLCEASGGAGSTYRNALFNGASMNQDGKITAFKNVADSEALLVSLCLFKVHENGPNQSVHVNTVRSWTDRVVKKLFKRAKEISDIEGEADDENPPQKEEPTSTETGSDLQKI